MVEIGALSRLSQRSNPVFARIECRPSTKVLAILWGGRAKKKTASRGSNGLLSGFGRRAARVKVSLIDRPERSGDMSVLSGFNLFSTDKTVSFHLGCGRIASQGDSRRIEARARRQIPWPITE
jgi:hypothetical protein